MKNKSAKNWLGVALGSAMAMSASVAQAAFVFESEINDTFATADAFNPNTQQPWGVIGSSAAAPSNDVDIWSFNLTGGSTFSADITTEALYNAADVNPIMTVYWENAGSYYPVATTDPDMFGTNLSFTAWATGNYFLTISADFNMGVDAFGNFATTDGFLTTESVLGTAWDHFNGGSFTSFKYDVNASVVPVPAAAWLFGSGLLGLVGVARRSHKA
jgi:hypothetical protein